MKHLLWVGIISAGLSPSLLAGCTSDRSGDREHARALLERAALGHAIATMPANAPPSRDPVATSPPAATPLPATPLPAHPVEASPAADAPRAPPWSARTTPGPRTARTLASASPRTPVPMPTAAPVEDEAAWVRRELSGVVAELTPPEESRLEAPVPRASATPLPAPTVLEPRREGPTALALPPIVKSELIDDGQSSLSMRAKVCVSDAGVPTHATIVHGSGYGLADEQVKAELMRWRYEPLVVGGKPLPFCEGVTLRFDVRG